ncbi:unnamed protein product [Larinioides sclopetarius]|uniref:Uncharacterized protein n=1 Tax=Larinioides sclopetarius TaxID=280406 RepID=A0AAV2AXP6_9ARAC
MPVNPLLKGLQGSVSLSLTLTWVIQWTFLDSTRPHLYSSLWSFRLNPLFAGLILTVYSLASCNSFASN